MSSLPLFRAARIPCPIPRDRASMSLLPCPKPSIYPPTNSLSSSTLFLSSWVPCPIPSAMDKGIARAFLYSLIQNFLVSADWCTLFLRRLLFGPWGLPSLGQNCLFEMQPLFSSPPHYCSAPGGSSLLVPSTHNINTKAVGQGHHLCTFHRGGVDEMKRTQSAKNDNQITMCPHQ